MFNFDPTHFIEIPADKLRDAINLVYDLSQPVGMGHLHWRPGRLDKVTEDAIMEAEPSGDIAVHMDYVHGRCCKFIVFKQDGKLWIRPEWHDHTEGDLITLLYRLGMKDAHAKIIAAQAAREAA